MTNLELALINLGESTASEFHINNDSVTTLDDFQIFCFIVMDPERAGDDDVESNAPAPTEGTAPAESEPVSMS